MRLSPDLSDFNKRIQHEGATGAVGSRVLYDLLNRGAGTGEEKIRLSRSGNRAVDISHSDVPEGLLNAGFSKEDWEGGHDTAFQAHINGLFEQQGITINNPLDALICFNPNLLIDTSTMDAETAENMYKSQINDRDSLLVIANKTYVKKALSDELREFLFHRNVDAGATVMAGRFNFDDLRRNASNGLIRLEMISSGSMAKFNSLWFKRKSAKIGGNIGIGPTASAPLYEYNNIADVAEQMFDDLEANAWDDFGGSDLGTKSRVALVGAGYDADFDQIKAGILPLLALSGINQTELYNQYANCESKQEFVKRLNEDEALNNAFRELRDKTEDLQKPAYLATAKIDPETGEITYEQKLVLSSDPKIKSLRGGENLLRTTPADGTGPVSIMGEGSGALNTARGIMGGVDRVLRHR